MEKLEKDQLFLLATQMDFPQLLNFCQTNKKINTLVCQRDDIWIYKLIQDFPDHQTSEITGSYKKIYETLFIRGLETIKRTFILNYNLGQLYNLKKLDLEHLEDTQIEEIPKEIGQLHNLQHLDLMYNQIEEIPKEIGQLHNLQELLLDNNQIEKIPKEIGQLHELQKLSLSDNQIKEIPKEIGQLHNLQEIFFIW